MPIHHQSSVPTKQSVEFLFLASHGLLSPIAAIRWACNRLKRSDTRSLTLEQQELVTHIHSNAKVLSKLFGSMLLLARNEDQTYSVRPEAISIVELLAGEAKEWEEQEGGRTSLACAPHLKVRADSALLDVILQNLFAVFAEASRTPRVLAIEAQQDDERVNISFTSAMELPFLQSVRTVDRLSETRPVVGGTPGLLLSLAHSLISFLDGTLTMREVDADTYSIIAMLPGG